MTDAERQIAQRRIAILERQLLDIKGAGDMLANCAYNIGQTEGEPLTPAHARALKRAQVIWDRVIKECAK